MPYTIIDGAVQSRNGQWFSYAYALDHGRLIFLTFFDHNVYSKEEFVSFRITKEA